MLHLKGSLPTHSKVSIILQIILITIYNFKRLFLQIENCNTNTQKPRKLNYLCTKSHHECYKTSKKYFLQNISSILTNITSSKEVE